MISTKSRWDQEDERAEIESHLATTVSVNAKTCQGVFFLKSAGTGLQENYIPRKSISIEYDFRGNMKVVSYFFFQSSNIFYDFLIVN